MFFRIRNPHHHDLQQYSMHLYNAAKRIIMCYPMRAGEYILDDFLKRTTKIGLKQHCLKILAACNFSESPQHEIIISLFDPKIEQIAQLITYGNMELKGSKILKEAFRIKPI